MICPSCGKRYPDNRTFCDDCGTVLLPSGRRTKGRLWPPILIMMIMFTIGAGVYLRSQETATVSDTPWFSISDGVLYFDEEQYTGSSALEVPATVEGQTVTALGDYCFYDCDGLTTVILPESLELIGEAAFYDCDGLRGIKGTEALRSVGTQAFYSCDALEAIYIPGSVDTIGQYAFDGCAKLRYIFYGSQNRDWNSLYPEKINENAQIYLVDPSSPSGFRLP